jgi:hypothetical protein
LNKFRWLCAHLVLLLTPPATWAIDKARQELFEPYTVGDIGSRRLDLEDLLWIINHHPSLDVAFAALNRLALTSQGRVWAGRLASHHVDDRVRAEAIKHCHDQRLMVRHVLSDPSELVRQAAFLGITAPPHLEEAVDSRFVDVRLAYLKRLGINSRSFGKLKNDPDRKVRREAERLSEVDMARQRELTVKLTAEHQQPKIARSSDRNRPN